MNQTILTVKKRGNEMIPDPKMLRETLEMKTPLIGFYDVLDNTPFEPIVQTKGCIFSAYQDWLAGKSISMEKGSCTCGGGKYWIGGAEFIEKSKLANMLYEREGFKASQALLEEWLENQKPYKIKNKYVVISPLKDDQYADLKTVTFFVNPDQLSMLLVGAEYYNTSPRNSPVRYAFGSGCCQLAAVFLNGSEAVPQAFLGAMDIAMRPHLPPDVLAFTVNKAMYEQLCRLDEHSFLGKSFWKVLKDARKV